MTGVLHVLGSLLGSGLGHCSRYIIRPIFGATMEFHGSHSVLRHSYSCAGHSVICDVPRLVPRPARSESVVWEPPSWLCDIHCGADCCDEADGSRCGAVCIPVWQGTETTSSTWSACLLHCSASSCRCRSTISSSLLLGHSCIVGLLAVLSSTHWKQKRWHGRQLLFCHVSVCTVLWPVVWFDQFWNIK